MKWEKILNFGQLEHLIVDSRQFKVDENTLEFFKMYVQVLTM